MGGLEYVGMGEREWGWGEEGGRSGFVGIWEREWEWVRGRGEVVGEGEGWVGGLKVGTRFPTS